MNSESYYLPRNSDRIGSKSSMLRKICTLDVTCAFGLLADVGDQRYDVHEDVVWCDSVNHLLFDVVDEFVMGQKHVGPFLT